MLEVRPKPPILRPLDHRLTARWSDSRVDSFTAALSEENAAAAAVNAWAASGCKLEAPEEVAEAEALTAAEAAAASDAHEAAVCRRLAQRVALNTVSLLLPWLDPIALTQKALEVQSEPKTSVPTQPQPQLQPQPQPDYPARRARDGRFHNRRE